MAEIEADRRKGRGRRRHQGRGHHVRQGGVFRRRRPHDAAGHGRANSRAIAKAEGEEAAMRAFSEGMRRLNPALSPARDLRQAVRRRDQRRLPGRRLRTALACHYRVVSDEREDPRRPAGDQGRPVPRRRRHAARAAPDADAATRCRCCSRATRSARRRQEDGPHPRGRARRRDRREGEGLGARPIRTPRRRGTMPGFKLPSGKVFSPTA